MALQSKRATVLLALALCASTPGCVRTYGHGGSGGGHGQVYSFVELEPNDYEAAANYFGSIAVGETLIVRGYIDDSGYDPFDGFAFTTVEPMDVEFYLTSDDPYTDLDLCYYNPYTGYEEACWETGYNPEAGVLALNGGRDFHLVVAAYWGASTYTLEVIGRPLGYAAAAAASSEAPAASGARGAPDQASAAPRAGAVPFERYRAPGPAEADEQAPPRVRGRLILVDQGSGAARTHDFELGPDGARTVPFERRP